MSIFCSLKLGCSSLTNRWLNELLGRDKVRGRAGWRVKEGWI
jgi:hypothetical protein